MKKSFMLVAGCFLLFAVAASADVFARAGNATSLGGYTNFCEADHITVWYPDADGSTAITAATCQTFLNELERLYRVYIDTLKYPHPYRTGTAYKINAVITRPNCNASNSPPCGSNDNTGTAFGGSTNLGGVSTPALWLPRTVGLWGYAHELVHALDTRTSCATAGGWFMESHANLLPHYAYPNEVHWEAPRYIFQTEIHSGSRRQMYYSWHFLDYLVGARGMESVNNICAVANSGTEDPYQKYMRVNSHTLPAFNDMFGDFAMKAVIWEIKGPRGEDRGTLYRNAYINSRVNASYSIDARIHRTKYTYLEALDGGNAANNRYVVPFAAAPQRFGFNIIRLYPDNATGTVTVRFRGDVQTQGLITVSGMPANPGSDWRYGLVAVRGDAQRATQAAAANVTARYSQIMRASDGNPNVAMQMQSTDDQLYLVVAATPTTYHFVNNHAYYQLYRFPYMVEINGAKPEGFQAVTNPAGRQHANGGGFVANTATVDATAYVGPNARVLGTARVEGTARIEGRAVVQGSAQVRGRAVVKDYAYVAGGQIYDDAVVSEGANIFNGQIYGNAKIYGAANITHANSRIYGNAEVGGITYWEGTSINVNLSGTARIYGDAHVGATITQTAGVYTGAVGTGGNTTAAIPAEITAPRSLQWYGDNTPIVNAAASRGSARSFRFDNSGNLRYDLGGAQSASLKVFDSRGRLLKTVRLSGSQNTVNPGISAAAQMLLWKVEIAGRVTDQGRVQLTARM